MKTYKEILNNKSTQQIRLITIHNILNDIDMNLLTEKAKQIFIKQNIQISDEQLSEYINYCAQQWLNAIRLTTIPQAYDNAISILEKHQTFFNYALFTIENVLIKQEIESQPKRTTILQLLIKHKNVKVDKTKYINIIYPIIKNFITTHNTSTDSEVEYNTVRDIIIDQLSILPELPAFNTVNEIKNTINTILE